MFPEAVRALFANLNAIPEPERSPYDRALHRELSIVLSEAESGRVSPRPESFKPRTLRQSVGDAAVRAVGKAAGLTVFTIGTSADVKSVVDFDSGVGAGAKKWTKCPKSDCPNKEL